MLKAFIMVALKTRAIQEGIDAIKKLNNVKKIYTMTGQYDLIVEFEGENTEDLHEFHFALDDIDGIDGVITNVVMKEFIP
ncbi:MAG: Lrp/AsnC family transcriptional regulator [Candidatus Hodarchaeota archaeon]